MTQQPRDTSSGRFLRRDPVAVAMSNADRAVKRGEAALRAHDNHLPGSSQDLRSAKTAVLRSLRELDELIFEVQAT
jgi:hypothetical protein